MFTPTLYHFTIESQIRKRIYGEGCGVKKRHPFLQPIIRILWVCVFTLLAAAGWADAVTPPSRSDRSAVEEKWGIQIVSIRQTAAGHMLDFRYRVVDAQKAAPLFARQTRPYLVDQASGKSLVVPNMAKVGPLRSSDPPIEGRTYWMFFGNPGVVKKGSSVTVVIGDLKIDKLIVQ